MHRFRFDFPGCRVLKFGTSYRLPEAICTATQSFISSVNIERIPKDLVSGKSSSFIPVNTNYLAKDLQLPSIKLNTNDDGLNMTANRAPIEVRGMENEEEEIKWIVSYLQDKTNEHKKMMKEHAEKIQQGHPNIPFVSDYSVVILTRHAKQLRVIEEKLKQQKITFFSRNYGSWDYQVRACFIPRLFFFPLYSSTN
jgi:superfamily I DNA/RNA helicase